MALNKKQKKEILNNLKDKISQQLSITFINFAGLKVEDFTDFRKKIRDDKGEVMIAKKTLIKLAFEDKLSSVAEEFKNLENEVALVFGFKNALNTIKSVEQYSLKNKNLKILAGVFEEKFISKQEVIQLAQLPSTKELQGKLVGTISAPLSNFVGVLQGNLKKIINIFNQVTLCNR